MKKILALIAIHLFCTAAAKASILVVDNGNTLTTTFDETFILSNDVTYGYVGLHGIVFHNVFADVFTDGNPITEIYDFRATVNGGTEILLSPWAGWNYRVGEDSPGSGWSPGTGLGLLWNANLLGGAFIGDSLRLFGSITHDKGRFHHLPNFAFTTVEFSSYEGNIFATQDVNQQHVSVPEPASIALLTIGLAGFGFSRKRKAA